MFMYFLGKTNSLLLIIEWKTKMVELIKVSKLFYYLKFLNKLSNVVHKITFITMYNSERHKVLLPQSSND